MSTDRLADEPVEAAVEATTFTRGRVEAALTVLFATAAVLLVSFFAVVSGIV